MPVRIALDAMGGDFAPGNEVAGAVLAKSMVPSDVEIILVGDEARLRPLLAEAGQPDRISIVHAPDVVTMSDEPSSIVKQRKESSLYVGIDLMREGKADAFVSGGNTGAVMATATMMCGRIPGVSRPTIGSFFPSRGGRPSLLVDIGANVDSKARFLVDFAIMGEIYARLIQGIDKPRVALLNVGEEETKGTEVVQEASAMLRERNIHYVGFCEGRDILSGRFDVIVCDGFEGNIVLKFAESVLGFLKDKLKTYAKGSVLKSLAMAMFAPMLKSALKDMDYQEYGGVPLLGINGVVIIGHGSSSPKALANMIKRAVEVVDRDVNGHIRAAMAAPNKPSAEQQ